MGNNKISAWLGPLEPFLGPFQWLMVLVDVSKGP